MLDKITKAFLLGENLKVDAQASIQALTDIVSNIRVINKRDNNRLKLAKEHIRGIKRHMRSLNEQVTALEQELHLLKEEK
jgi:hypothetical protein|tara:strand:- start:94 stop:333 length:240 start_codon:yes stop_codon:yes gene_type:complete